MSNCIKNIYDYVLIKKCPVCKNTLLSSNCYLKKLKEMD